MGKESVFMGKRERKGLVSWGVGKEEVEWFKERREGERKGLVILERGGVRREKPESKTEGKKRE